MKKVILFLVIIMVFANISYASSYQDIYDAMKDDYPELVNRMTESEYGVGVTEEDILNFLDDLSEEVNKGSDLTEENFDNNMYKAVRKVLFKDGSFNAKKNHNHKFAVMLATEFLPEIRKALKTKTLEGDLKGLNESVRSVLLNQEDGDNLAEEVASAEEPDEIHLEKIMMNLETLEASFETLSNGQIEVTISEDMILKNINEELSRVSEDKGTVSDKLSAVLDLRLERHGKSYKVQLPSLNETFKKVHSLSILTDLGSIIVEKDFLSEEHINGNLDFLISQDDDVFELKLAKENQEIKAFIKPIIVSLPYELQSDQNKEYITVVHIDENENEMPMGGIYDNDSIKFYTHHLSTYKVKYDLKSFTDIADVDWAKDKITALASKGIINGRSEGIFDPKAHITRSEFTALAVRVMKLQGNKEINDFSDVSVDAWYTDSVAAAYQKGIIKGRTVDTFDPNGKVTLEEALVILARIMNTKGYPVVEYSKLQETIAKENISEWTKSEIGTALHNNLQKDMKIEDFIPNEFATRAQVASVIYEFYNKILGEN